MKDNPHLIGQIALEAGFINPDQLDACLALQARDPKPLGELLVQGGYLTEEQFAEVRRAQASRFERLEADPARGGLFGQLAVRLGFLSAADLHRTLREQAGSSLQLGQLLLKKKRLTSEQFLEILRRQNRDIAQCPRCHAFYDLTGQRSEPFLCVECRTVVPHQA
ncbi:MAG TPA: hypothetical protein VF950_07805 [Planctomycetota bacterium]